MINVQVTHRFPGVDPDTFASVYYSRAFNDAVAKTAGLKERALQSENTREDGCIERRIKMRPDVDLPKPVNALLQGAEISFVEVSVYDPKTRTSRYHVESGAQEMVQVSGVITFKDDGEAGTLREIDGQATVKILGLGKLIEKLIVREVTGRYDRIQAFTEDYLKTHPPA